MSWPRSFAMSGRSIDRASLDCDCKFNPLALGQIQDGADRPRADALAPHAQAVIEHANAAGISLPTATLMNHLGVLLWAKALYAEAEPFIRRALAINKKSYGPDHPNVAMDLNILALLLRDTNRLSEGEPLIRRALAIDEKSYGPHHPDVARDLNNLAELLRATDRLSEAEPLYRRALAISEKSYGPHHPNVATRLNNLAGLPRATNRLSEAEPLIRRALAIFQKSYGADHRAMDSGAARNPQDPTTWGKVRRNEPCPCGSGKRYKHCHGSLV
jgi:tetratricopeptide (TPR) repeat protein